MSAHPARLALAAFAVAPHALGGVVVRARVGPAREAWLGALAEALPEAAPRRVLPTGVGDDRLLGGLDLAASLGAGRAMLQAGVLAQAHGGVLIAPMAERLAREAAARIGAALDEGAVVIEREGLSARSPAAFGLVLLDEGVERDEAPPGALVERLAFRVDLDGLRPQDVAEGPDPATIAAARAAFGGVTASAAALEELVAVAAALGVASLRAPILALRAARAFAALERRGAVTPEDCARAAALCLAPRATRLPQAPSDAETEPDAPPEQPDQSQDGAADAPTEAERPLGDVILEAALAALPPDLLAALADGRSLGASDGASGAKTKSARRGRPTPPRAGQPKGAARLDIVATLRAAAPWQAIRRGERTAEHGRRVEIRSGDFRVRRRESRTESLLIFVVDASGSAAMRRLAEAKGAVELVLAESYKRRDHVALISFRGLGAELLLPPTRALARAKRGLAGLPGGGPTPLAAGLDMARMVAEAARRGGRAPSVILLTDGQANVRRDGGGGRDAATADAHDAARRLRAMGAPCVLLDLSPRPQAKAEALAAAMGAAYHPLPRADAAAVAAAVEAAR